jgi:hypothetical protein
MIGIAVAGLDIQERRRSTRDFDSVKAHSIC